MLPNEDKDSIIARYSDRFAQHGTGLKTLNTGAGDKHLRQHTLHSSLFALEGKSILDIGCGLAHYYEFLKSRGISVKYTGYDIVEPFITSNRQRYPECNFEVRDIFREGIAITPDVVTFCQVFNNKYQGASNDDIVKRAITIAFEKATVGVSIDMLGNHVNYQEPHLHYFSPEAMFTFAKSLTRFVSLRHDYLPYDFTLVLYKTQNL